MRPTVSTFLLLCSLLLWIGPTAIARGGDDLSAYVGGAIEFFNEHARDPLPRLTSKQMTKLVEGEVVVIVRREVRAGDDPEASSHDRVVGYAVVEQPRESVWLAALDPDSGYPENYRYARLSTDGTGGSTWYTHLDLPWPVADRHWMVDLDKGLQVAEASDGLIWEHRWDLSADGEARSRELVGAGGVEDLTVEDVEKSVYLPVNYGGVLAIVIDDTRTLFVYHLTTDVGGYIPDGVVTTFAKAQVGRFMEELRRDSVDILEHYVGNHEVVYTGTGQPIRPATGR